METSTLSSISRSRGSWWWLYVTHKSRAGEVVPSVPCPSTPATLSPAVVEPWLLSCDSLSTFHERSWSHVRFCGKTGHRLFPAPHETSKVKSNRGK